MVLSVFYRVRTSAGMDKGYRRMKGKLYIKTHGCQMNEYDSDKMADVLAASHGLELT